MAEHYMCAYLANAVINGKNDAISKLNDVRASYGAAAIPIDNAGLEGSRRDNAAEVARRKFAAMTISKATLSNFAHYIDRDDRQEAYYDMENNPWEELCNVFWKITEQLILTSD